MAPGVECSLVDDPHSLTPLLVVPRAPRDAKTLRRLATPTTPAAVGKSMTRSRLTDPRSREPAVAHIIVRPRQVGPATLSTAQRERRWGLHRSAAARPAASGTP